MRCTLSKKRSDAGQIVGFFIDQTGYNSQGFLATPVSQPPKAIRQNVTVNAGPTGNAAASIDNGSYEPNGNPVTLTQAPQGPYPLGTTPVTLTVADSKDPSSQSQRIAIVTVFVSGQCGPAPCSGGIEDYGW